MGTLTDDIKVLLRLTSSAYDVEVNMLIAAAKQDLLRVGVPASMVEAEPVDSLVKQAICIYAKAHFGYDNDEASRLQESYHNVVVDLVNSYTVRGEDEV